MFTLLLLPPVDHGGAFLHSGVLVALINCTFEYNMAGEDGLAVMSVGIAEKISALSFRNNSFSCTEGKYGLAEDLVEVRPVLPDVQICRGRLIAAVTIAVRLCYKTFFSNHKRVSNLLPA